MFIPVIIMVEAPDDATHYTGELIDEPTWYKMTKVGVVGDHWWFWNTRRDVWHFSGYNPPHFLKEIPRS